MADCIGVRLARIKADKTNGQGDLKKINEIISLQNKDRKKMIQQAMPVS